MTVCENIFIDVHLITLFFEDIVQLLVQTSEEVMEGQQVTMSCGSSCILKQNSVIWKKDGRTLTNKQTKNNDLILPNIRIEDEGEYTCALKDQENHPSPPRRLTVMCEYACNKMAGPSNTHWNLI